MRKNVPGINDAIEDAFATWKALSEIKADFAQEVYDAQDDVTKKALDVIIYTLRSSATGYISLQLQPPFGQTVPMKIDNTYLGFNLKWLAVEIAKNLAILDLRVAHYEWPNHICSRCGEVLQIPELTRGKKAGREKVAK